MPSGRYTDNIIYMAHNIEDIIPPSRRDSFSNRSRDVAGKMSEFLSEKKKETTHQNRPMKRRHAYTPAIIALGVIIISVGALLFFSGARVEIVPKTDTAPISLKLTAETSSTSTLPYSLITIDKRVVQYISASTTRTVKSIATGKLTIYNTLSTPLNFVVKTRFRTLSGLMFYLDKPIRIPGGHGVIPGTVTVSVSASKAGDIYNIKPSFFSIPGLANTSLANKVYAKSANSMTGGVSGVVPIISNKKKLQIQIALRGALERSLLKDISSKVPSGYTLLPGATTTTYTTLPNVLATSTASKKIGLQEDGVITAIIFPTLSLSRNVASKMITTYDGVAPVYIQNPQGLTLTPLGTFPNSKTQSFRFMLSGQATIVWSINKVSIAAAIAGKSHQEAQTIVGALPSVQKAYLVLHPFWVNVFPKDPSKINVTVSQPQ